MGPDATRDTKKEWLLSLPPAADYIARRHFEDGPNA